MEKLCLDPNQAAAACGDVWVRGVVRRVEQPEDGGAPTYEFEPASDSDGEATGTVQIVSGSALRAATLKKGDRVEAQKRKCNRWCPGTVVAVHANGTYDVDFDREKSSKQGTEEFNRLVTNSSDDEDESAVVFETIMTDDGDEENDEANDNYNLNSMHSDNENESDGMAIIDGMLVADSEEGASVHGAVRCCMRWCTVEPTTRTRCSTRPTGY